MVCVLYLNKVVLKEKGGNKYITHSKIFSDRITFLKQNLKCSMYSYC